MNETKPRLERILRYLLFAAYALGTFTLMMHHEPWADELQAWLIARDSTVPQLFRAMRFEGHFIPWYLMLRVFAANGGPVLCMNVLAWAFLTAAAAVFIFRANLSIRFKTIVLCSCGMLYWYPVVARCYAPIPVLMFGLAALYPNRLKHPLPYGLLLGILANTHAYIEGFCGMLFVLWFLDFLKLEKTEETKRSRRFVLGGMGLAAAGAIFAFAQVAPGLFIARSVGSQRFWPRGMSFYERLSTSLVDFAGCSKEVANVAFPLLQYLWILLGIVLIAWFCRRYRTFLLYLTAAALIFPAFYFALPPHQHAFQSGFQLFLDFVFLPFFLVAMLMMFRASLRMGMLLLAAFLWMLFFSMYMFYLLPQRALLIFLTYVFCFWVLRENPSEWERTADGKLFRLWEGATPPSRQKRLAEIIFIYVMFSIPGCVSFVIQDYALPFSGAKNMGEYLSRTLPPGTQVILPHYSITDAAITAYAPGLKFFCVESGHEITYCPLDWTRAEVRRNVFEKSPHWDKAVSGPGPHYFVCGMRFLRSLPNYTMTFRIRDRVFTEIYRSPRIWFTTAAGEQYWLFSDEADRIDDFSGIQPKPF